MEKELHITASVPLQIQSCKETFYANRGYGTVELTPYGDYLLGCPVRCSEKQMLKSPIKLLI